MKFGINLGGGNLPGESREEALAGRLEKSRLAKKHGYHSLWTGAGYLNNDFHAMLLLSRAAAEAPGLELGMVALLPLYHPVEARRANSYSGCNQRRQVCAGPGPGLAGLSV